MMDKETYMRAILECNFAGFKDEIIDIAVRRIMKYEPKRGRWEVVDEAEPRRYGCSECKRLSWTETNYCPNCGADMRGGK